MNAALLSAAAVRARQSAVRGGRAGGRRLVKFHDCLLVYTRNYGKHIYNRQYMPYSDKYVTEWFRHTDDDGRVYRTRSRNGKIILQYLDAPTPRREYGHAAVGTSPR